jgi:hypothetical protein
VSCCRRCVSVDTTSTHPHTDVPQVRGLAARRAELAALKRKYDGVETAHDDPAAVQAAGRRARKQEGCERAAHSGAARRRVRDGRSRDARGGPRAGHSGREAR